MDEQHLDPSSGASTTADRTSRRRVVALGAAAAGVAWVTPAVLSVEAAAAATDVPPPAPGSLSGEVTRCGHALDQGETYLVTATQNPGGFVGSTTAPDTGTYVIPGLPAGSYDVTLHPNGTNLGQPDQSYPAAAVVPAGGSVVFSPDYTAQGC